MVVVDCSKTSCKILEVCLSRAGFRVLTFADERQAYKNLIDCFDPPALFLIEVNLPEMSGYQLAKLFRAHPKLSAVPILFLSRRTGVVDRLKALLAGGAGLIPKPLIVQDIVATVQENIHAADLPTEHMPKIGDDASSASEETE
ncbi:response regulator [Thermosporothrix hazakensis]|uniref:response regulator n=1 Tax=Thermosporothrix hazakensis TaxID=644383 RepID=UPI001FEAFF7C|nr:response regulator [Thermosporothrix hazakensis]